MFTSAFSFTCFLYKSAKWFYAFIIYYMICQTEFQLRGFSHMTLNDWQCRTKCPALIHECRTYNIFYRTMPDVRRLFRSLLGQPRWRLMERLTRVNHRLPFFLYQTLPFHFRLGPATSNTTHQKYLLLSQCTSYRKIKKFIIPCKFKTFNFKFCGVNFKTAIWQSIILCHWNALKYSFQTNVEFHSQAFIFRKKIYNRNCYLVLG